MAEQGWATPGLEKISIKRKAIALKVAIYGSTTEGSITAQILNSQDVGARVWLSSQSATAPADANFASLLSAGSPTIIGLYLTVGDAKYLHGAAVPVNSIKSASMTAGVITNKGATHAITGNTGVTSGLNIALQVSCTTLQANLALNHEFNVDLVYECV